MFTNKCWLKSTYNNQKDIQIMKKICLYFQVHQPMRLKRYRFFDIGTDHYYYDDYLNESIMQRVARNCYLPTNELILKLIKEYGCQFKVAFSITGIALDQFRLYAPEVLDSFKKLAKSGCVEFLSETYSHSLVSLKDEEEFQRQVIAHRNRMEEFFGYTPKVFRNTELIYSNDISQKVADMGFTGMITEGANHVLGWKSPNFMYCSAVNPKLKVLLKNHELSDDIAFRFSNKGWPEYPLTAEKFATWLDETDEKDETINLFMDYETFGEHQSKHTGIFDFLKELPKEIFKKQALEFATPSELFNDLQPISSINVPYPISWADAERDLTAWLGNNLQEDSFNRLYTLGEKVEKCHDPKIKTDWKYLQASDHFYYMCTKIFSDGDVHSYFNPFNSPYDAYINYMNILSDFILRLNDAVPESAVESELAHLHQQIKEKSLALEEAKVELNKLKNKKTAARKTATAATTKTTTKQNQSTTKKPPSATTTKKKTPTNTSK